MGLLYLAGAIKDCTDEEARGWREQVKEIYPDALDPMVRDYRGCEDENVNEIVVLDKRDVDQSDIVLVRYLWASAGTSMEIYHAWLQGKPVIVWHDEGQKLSPWITYHGTTFVTSFEAAMEKVEYYDKRR